MKKIAVMWHLKNIFFDFSFVMELAVWIFFLFSIATLTFFKTCIIWVGVLHGQWQCTYKYGTAY
jgi:hypothetical protein